MIDIKLELERAGFTLDVEFSIPSHGVTALFGPSGCGKTSILRCMAGLERACKGKIKIRDQYWQDDSNQLFVPPNKRSLGFVFQHPALFPHLSVRNNLAYASKRAAGDPMPFDEVVAMTGIQSLLDRGTQNLSGGEKQRVALARVLLTSPQLLLLDEPLASLDLSSKKELMPYLERLHEQLSIPIVYVSHSIDEVVRLADHVVLIRDGRIYGSGPLAQTLSRVDLYAGSFGDAVSVIEAEVIGHDADYHLSRLRFSGGELLLPRSELETGARVRVAIHARDVSLTLNKPEKTSILNILPARIEDITHYDVAQVLVRLKIGDAWLLTRITRKSEATLQLEPGKPVFAQVKSVSLVE